MSSKVESKSIERRIYELVSKIPRGKVVSYKHIADVLELRDIRIVGWILNKNHSPSIPCHRVVKSNGELGGYNRGEYEKVKKLRQEGVEVIKKGDKYVVPRDYFYTFPHYFNNTPNSHSKSKTLNIAFVGLVAIVAVFVFISMSWAGEITKCGKVEGGVYYLNKSINGGGTCLEINNATVDCRGYAIAGDGSKYSTCVYLKDAQNITLKNCRLVNCEYGVYGKNISRFYFYNLTTDARFPLYIEYFSSGILSSMFSSSSSSVVYLRHGKNSALINLSSNMFVNFYKMYNTSLLFSFSPLSVLASSHIYIYNNTISNNKPIYAHESEYVFISYNHITSSYSCVELYMVKSSNVSYNTLTSSAKADKGVGIYYSEFNNIFKNNISRFRHGIYTFESYFNNIFQNNISTSDYAITQKYSAKNRVENNTYSNILYAPISIAENQQYIEDIIWEHIKDKAKEVYDKVLSYLPPRHSLNFYISLFVFSLAFLSLLYFLIFCLHHLFNLLSRIQHTAYKE